MDSARAGLASEWLRDNYTRHNRPSHHHLGAERYKSLDLDRLWLHHALHHDDEP